MLNEFYAIVMNYAVFTRGTENQLPQRAPIAAPANLVNRVARREEDLVENLDPDCMPLTGSDPELVGDRVGYTLQYKILPSKSRRHSPIIDRRGYGRMSASTV